MQFAPTIILLRQLRALKMEYRHFYKTEIYPYITPIAE